MKAVRVAATPAGAQWSSRILMLGLNVIPALHAVATLLLVLLPYAALPVRIGAALGFLYLAPPIAARLVQAFVAIPVGKIALGSRPFFGWWAIFQLQVLFCRVTILEEVLRLVPGLYSLWLRMWGARVGRFTYWSAGTLISDRSYVCVGDDVVFGAGVRLVPHVLARNREGRLELILGAVKIGDGVMVGGYSVLSAGTEISPGEVTRACLLSPPFSVWKDGKRVRAWNCEKDD